MLGVPLKAKLLLQSLQPIPSPVAVETSSVEDLRAILHRIVSLNQMLGAQLLLRSLSSLWNHLLLSSRTPQEQSAVVLRTISWTLRITTPAVATLTNRPWEEASDPAQARRTSSWTAIITVETAAATLTMPWQEVDSENPLDLLILITMHLSKFKEVALRSLLITSPRLHGESDDDECHWRGRVQTWATLYVRRQLVSYSQFDIPSSYEHSLCMCGVVVLHLYLTSKNGQFDWYNIEYKWTLFY